MKLILFIIVMLNAIHTLGQINQEDKLVNALMAYKQAEYDEDSVKTQKQLQQLTAEIEYTLQHYPISDFKKFKQAADSLYITYSTSHSVNNGLWIFTLSNHVYHWNYVMRNTKILHKDNKKYRYFYEVHTLNETDFLLLERMDDMSFSCYYAQVYALKNANPVRQNAFPENELRVCSWTHVDESYPAIENDSLIVKGTHQTYEPITIWFNAATKTISYSFTTLDGKPVTRKAGYRNGKFKIKSYDARTFDE